MKRKGPGGVWRDLNLRSIPGSLKTALRNALALQPTHAETPSSPSLIPNKTLRSLWDSNTNLPWQKNDGTPVIEVTVVDDVDDGGPVHRTLAARRDKGKSGGALRYMYVDWDTGEVTVAEVIRGKAMFIVGRKGIVDLPVKRLLTQDLMDDLSQELFNPLIHD